MKKFLVMLVAFLCLSFSLMAQTTKSCKISGQTDGATVVASIIEVGDGYVLVELDNDGNAPVNVTVKVTCNRSSVSNGQRSCKVSPQASNTIKITMNGAKKDHNINEYKINSLSGQRCN